MEWSLEKVMNFYRSGLYLVMYYSKVVWVKIKEQIYRLKNIFLKELKE